MAHRQHHNSMGGSGIESLTPPTGQFTALIALLAFTGAVWITFKHPSVFARCVIGAATVSSVVVLLGGTPNPANNPLVALVMAGVGVCALPRRKPNQPQPTENTNTENTNTTEESK